MILTTAWTIWLILFIISLALLTCVALYIKHILTPIPTTESEDE